MKTIIIVCTLGMMQGFLDAYVPSWQCLPEIKDIFYNLGVDAELLLDFTNDWDESIYSIRSLMYQVQWKLENSDAKDTDCINQLSERLDEINRSYEAELIAHVETAANSDIGIRLKKCYQSLIRCIVKAPKCSDTPSCIKACENALYGDDTPDGGKINAFLTEYQSDLRNELEKIKNKVNEINVSIPSCIKLN